ncbi:MAG: hypothetical protein H0V80_00185, partial [Acidobacteria bacterium]|nr:hypothetical protein [Acidobacteriota bacterium]
DGPRPAPAPSYAPGRGTVASRPARWLDVHHAVTAMVYVAMLWPGWLVADALPGRWRGAAHLALVSIAACASSLRLHLWFSGRHYPSQLAWRRRRLRPAVVVVDVLYAVLLATMAVLAADTRVVAAVVCAGLAVCLLVASLLIEPATQEASDSRYPQNTSR